MHKPVKNRDYTYIFLNVSLWLKIRKKTKTLQHCIRHLLTWRRISQVSKCKQDFSSSPVSSFPLPASLPRFSPPPCSTFPQHPPLPLRGTSWQMLITRPVQSIRCTSLSCFGKNSTQFWGYFIWFLAYILHDFPLIPLSITWLVPGNSAQCYVAAWMGWEFGGEWIHVYIWLSPLKLSKHC